MRQIHAVTANDYTPLNFIDPTTGKAVGWEYDAVNEIGRRLDREIVWEVVSWEAMIQSIREGQYDVGMDGISITEERSKEVDFSRPYMTASQYMLVRTDEERFDDATSLGADPNLLIGAQSGNTNYYVALSDILGGEDSDGRLRLFDNFGLIVQALLGGDIDVTLMDAASARGYIGASANKLKIAGEPLRSDEFGFIFAKDSPLVAEFNQVLDELEAEGFLAELNNKWFFEYQQGE